MKKIQNDNSISIITKQATNSNNEDLNNESELSYKTERKHQSLMPHSPLLQRSKSHHCKVVNEEVNEDDDDTLSPHTKTLIMNLMGKTIVNDIDELIDLDLNDENDNVHIDEHIAMNVDVKIPTIYNRILKHEEMSHKRCEYFE